MQIWVLNKNHAVNGQSSKKTDKYVAKVIIFLILSEN